MARVQTKALAKGRSAKAKSKKKKAASRAAQRRGRAVVSARDIAQFFLDFAPRGSLAGLLTADNATISRQPWKESAMGDKGRTLLRSTSNYDPWLDESVGIDEAAKFLGVEKHWLDRMRSKGNGPRFTRVSRKIIGYTRRALMDFRDKNTFGSTAEYPEKQDGPHDGEPSPSDPAAGIQGAR